MDPRREFPGRRCCGQWLRTYRMMAGLLLVAFTLFTTHAVQAQSIGISALSSSTTDPAIGNQFGGAVDFAFPVGGRTFASHIAIQSTFGSAHHFEQTCVPALCSVEPMTGHTRTVLLQGKLQYPVQFRRGYVLSIAGALRAANITDRSTGAVTGITTQSSNIYWGGEVGLDGWWVMSRRVPIAFETGVATGFLAPVIKETGLDQYVPFNNGFKTFSLRVGVSWQFPAYW